MELKIGHRVRTSNVELEKLNDVILATDIAVNPLPFTVVGGDDFTNEYAVYNSTIVNYDNARELAEVYSQQRWALAKPIRQMLGNMGRYIKALNPTHYKQLRLWGFDVVLTKRGKVNIPARLVTLEKLVDDLLDKHTVDGTTSILNLFDMISFQANVIAYKLAKVNYETQRLNWRAIAVVKRDLYKSLIAKQRLIANEMLANPNIAPRDLEAWGYTVIEFHKKSA